MYKKKKNSIGLLYKNNKVSLKSIITLYNSKPLKWLAL